MSQHFCSSNYPCEKMSPTISRYGGNTYTFFFVILGARHSACTIPTWLLFGGRGPLKHLCNLEARYRCVWAPNFGGAAPGFEPRTSCLRVRSVTITLREPPRHLYLIQLNAVESPTATNLHKF